MLDIFKLDGYILEMVISGKTADISPLCEFGFLDWAKFRDSGVAFPGDPLVLGKDLGQRVDVVQHVMKANSKVKDHLTIWFLAP